MLNYFLRISHSKHVSNIKFQSSPQRIKAQRFSCLRPCWHKYLSFLMNSKCAKWYRFCLCDAQTPELDYCSAFQMSLALLFHLKRYSQITCSNFPTKARCANTVISLNFNNFKHLLLQTWQTLGKMERKGFDQEGEIPELNNFIKIFSYPQTTFNLDFLFSFFCEWKKLLLSSTAA